MKVTKLKTNQINNPLGFDFTRLSFSWITESQDWTSKYQDGAQVLIALDEEFEQIMYDSGQREDIDSLAFTPDIELQPRTRYFWRVTVWGDAGEAATSETAKIDEDWQGQWIAPSFDKEIHPLIRKSFQLPEDISIYLRPRYI